MSYFQKNSKKLNLKLKVNENDLGVRKCQMGAYWATLAHYTSSDKPALIVMPTGSGKTAVMMLVAFGHHANRILIVTPSIVLRDQTAGKFSSLNDLVKAGIYPDSAEKPKVLSHEGRITSTDKWNVLREYDVVVATPHTISSEQHEEILPPPDDLFDIVFFDEAHHTPAKTWADLLKSFKNSKCVLLTATPFRQDKLQLLARIIYNYPVGNALEDGIYRPIEYHSIESLTGTDKDALLCEKAKELLVKERRLDNRTKILIRTDEVQKSNSLLTLYNNHGIGVKEINYKKSEKEIKSVLNDIKEDRLDGIICIGMLGEGLDIPELKIAVLHNPPQSLPITLQFIGRLSRPVMGVVGDAHVIANPDDVKGQMRDLYMQDTSWRKLIPKLADEAVTRVEDYGKIILVDEAVA